jgi:hypothetical protein
MREQFATFASLVSRRESQIESTFRPELEALLKKERRVSNRG